MKPGYKQTEIGLIPEDWDISQFGEKVKIYRGGSPRPIQDYLTDADTGVNWIKIGDVPPDGKYVRATEEKIRPEGVSRSREVHAGDFILSNSMSFGRPYILEIDGCIHDGWLTIQNYEKTFLTDYLYYLLSSDSIFKQYIAMAAGSSVKNLNKEKVSALVVAYPKRTDEQRSIAEALSEVDELIASLEKLIEKKKAIKQGAMQELLTGKHRLPGFSGEWEKATIGELVTRKQASLQTGPFGTVLKASEYVDHGISIVSVREIREGRIEIFDETPGVSDLTYHRLPQFVLKAYDIVFARKGSVDRSALIPENAPKLFLGSDGIRLRFSDSALAQFVFQYIQSHEIQQFLSTSAYGTTMVGLNETIISSIPIFVPVNRKEQQSIVEVLSETGKMIASLEKLLDQKKAIKQGMMQQLLTGLIRL